MVAKRKRRAKKRPKKRVSRARRVKRRAPRAVRRRARRDSLQWRVSNSLLILVLGMMFLGYGASQFAEQPVTGLQIVGGDLGGGIVTPGVGETWPYFKNTVDRAGHVSTVGPDNSNLRFVYDTGSTSQLTYPVVGMEKVFFGSQAGKVYAVDWRGGDLVWRYPQTGSVSAISSMAYSAGMVYAGASNGNLYAINATTGNWKWTYQAAGTIFDPIVIGSSIYFGAGDGKFYSVKSDGTLNWKKTGPSRQEGGTCTITTSALYYKSNFYLGTQDCGIVKYDLNGNYKAKYETNSKVQKIPSASDDRIYFATVDGNFYVLGTDMTRKYNSNIGAGTSPTITADGKFAIMGAPNQNKVKAVQTGVGGLTAGTVVWSIDAELVATAVAVDSSKAYYVSPDGKTYAVSLTDGSSEWSYDTGAWMLSPALADKAVYVATNDGKLYGIGPDRYAPAASNVAQSDDAPDFGETVTVSADWTDNLGLDHAVLEVKEGSLAAVNKSTVDLTGLSDTSAFEITATQSSGTIIKWKIYAFDGDGNAGVTDEMSFIVYEEEAPVVKSMTHTSGKIGKGGTNALTVELTDNYALKEATLATDETGTWRKWTDGTYGSPASLSEASETVSFAWKNSAMGIGKKISWKVYVKDASGNEVISDVRTFEIVSDVSKPDVSMVGQKSASIGEGGANYLYVKWADNNALSRAELWVGEGTDTLTKKAEKVLSGKSAWSNFTYTPTSPGGTIINWQVKAYDLAGNTESTALQSFTVVKDETDPTYSNVKQSSDSVEVSRAIALSADIADNIALKEARLEINGVIVQTLDLTAVESTTASFDYVPDVEGDFNWRIFAEDSAGNSVVTTSKTFQATARLLECPPPQPLPSPYGACKDDTQSRVVYTCDTDTGSWTGSIETIACEEPFKELPVAYMLVGLVLIALAVSSLLLYKKRFGKAGPRETSAPQW